MTERQNTPRMTQATLAVLRAMLENPTRELYGLEICSAAGLPTGTVHPILARLEGMGWLESSWEQVDARKEGRPRRRYYTLSDHGAMRASAALARADAQTAGLRALRPGTAGGTP
jgi:PadR family transcriptional regulator, regulatory protein PadR